MREVINELVAWSAMWRRHVDDALNGPAGQFAVGVLVVNVLLYLVKLLDPAHGEVISQLVFGLDVVVIVFTILLVTVVLARMLWRAIVG